MTFLIGAFSAGSSFFTSFLKWAYLYNIQPWERLVGLEIEKPAVACRDWAWQGSLRWSKISLHTLRVDARAAEPLRLYFVKRRVRLNSILFPPTPFTLSSPLPNTQPSCSASAPPLCGQLLAVTSERWWGAGGCWNTWSLASPSVLSTHLTIISYEIFSRYPQIISDHQHEGVQCKLIVTVLPSSTFKEKNRMPGERWLEKNHLTVSYRTFIFIYTDQPQH